MVTKICSKCGTPSQPKQVNCGKCGALLFDLSNSTVHMRIDPALLRLHRNRQETAAPAVPARTVLMQIRGLTERLVIEEGTEIVLGRIDLNQPASPRFDLTRFGAHERGVSREHARLSFKNNQLTVTDLGSINGTSVNLKRLTANQPHVLANGDELMLGRLSLMLHFETAPEPRPADVPVDETKPTRGSVVPRASKDTVAISTSTNPGAASSEKVETQELDRLDGAVAADPPKPASLPLTSNLAAIQEKNALRASDSGAAAQA